LLSPMLSINMCRLACSDSTIEAEKHHFMFGYTPDNQFLQDGTRIISIPSALFEVPYVHDYKTGSPGFQIYFHDVCYHVILDMNNPHINEFIKLAKQLKLLAKEQIPTPLKKFIDLIASLLVDREAIQFRYHSTVEVFFTFIQYALNEAFEIVNNEATIADKCFLDSFDFDKWLEKVFIPLIYNSLKDSKTLCLSTIKFDELKTIILLKHANY